MRRVSRKSSQNISECSNTLDDMHTSRVVLERQRVGVGQDDVDALALGEVHADELGVRGTYFAQGRRHVGHDLRADLDEEIARVIGLEIGVEERLGVAHGGGMHYVTSLGWRFLIALRDYLGSARTTHCKGMASVAAWSGSALHE